ncbi:hypothetical protein A245_44405, partial [Pseudomonas syringae pv. actinidiae ICMP 19096]
FGGVAIDGLFDASSEGVVLVRSHASARQADADQAVLAVIAVFGDEFLSGAATFTDLAAVSA